MCVGCDKAEEDKIGHWLSWRRNQVSRYTVMAIQRRGKDPSRRAMVFVWKVSCNSKDAILLNRLGDVGTALQFCIACSLNNPEKPRIMAIRNKKIMVKQSRYRPGQAQRVLRKLRFPDFVTTAQDCGKVVSLTHWPTLPPGNIPGNHFC